MAKLKSMTNKILQNLDAFGQPVQLFFDGATLHKTVFGGIITLLIILLVLSFVIVLAVDLFARKNFTASVERIFNVNPGLLDLSNGFMFSVGVQDTEISLNNSVFSYTLLASTFIEINGEIIQTNQISIPLHPCTLNDYPSFAAEFDQFILNTTMCPNLTNISIQGKYFSPIFTYLKVNVSKCENGTNIGVTCASDEYIQNYFTNSQKIRVVLYFINSVVDLNDYLNPFVNKFIDDLDWIVSPNSDLRISTDLYFQTNIVNSLDNILGIGNGWNISTLGYQRFKNDHAFIPNMTKYNSYLEIYLRSDNYDTLTVRKYETIPEILSIISGIWNVFYLVLGFLAVRYNKELFKIDLANVLYDFDTVTSGVSEPGDEVESDYDYNIDDDNHDDDDENENSSNNGNMKKYDDDFKKNKSKKETDLNQNNSQINIENIPVKQANQSTIDESSTHILTNIDFQNKFNALRTKRRMLKYSGKDHWTTLFNCCSKKKVKKKNLLLHKANTKLASDIDIRIILKRLKEVSHIKNALFDQHQLAIFNFVPPELITLEKKGTDDQIRKIHLAQQAKYFKNQLKDLHVCCRQDQYLLRHMSYSLLKTKNDTVSQNIIQKLDKEIKEIFEFLDEKKNEANLNISNNLDIQSKFTNHHTQAQHSKKNAICLKSR